MKNKRSEIYVSVIIPVYNGSQTIKRCLESVFKASYPLFECITVDDHSNDKTIQIAQSFDVKIVKLDRQYGAAYARNRGAETAKGDILLFIDADVTIYPDCIEKVVESFHKNPGISALFGTYDDKPDKQNFLSQYKNLFHHYIHQTSNVEASTFWTACGAIKKDVFFEVGKFNEKVRMMEDIELGYRLKARNYKIHLDKGLVVKHLKHYSFTNLLRSDLFDRAIPWTLLMLNSRQHEHDLNLKWQHRISAIIVIFMLVFAALVFSSLLFIAAVPMLFILFYMLNLDFYRFYIKKRGIVFTLKVIPFHMFYYLYSTIGFLIGHYKYYIRNKTV